MPLTVFVADLHKTYPGRSGQRALHPLSFRIEPGELAVVLGPNGAGKTTLFKILATLVRPDGGQASVAGFDLSDSLAIRQRVGMVSDPDRSFFWRLDARQNLAFFAAGYGLRGAACRQRIDELAELLEFADFAGRPVGQLSSGQRGRLALARALMHRPALLLLDEPTRSLDPGAAARFLDWLRVYLSAHPYASVLLASHHLEAVAAYCDRVLILKQGRLLADGALSELLAQTRLLPAQTPGADLVRLYNHLVDAGQEHAR